MLSQCFLGRRHKLVLDEAILIPRCGCRGDGVGKRVNIYTVTLLVLPDHDKCRSFGPESLLLVLLILLAEAYDVAWPEERPVILGEGSGEHGSGEMFPEMSMYNLADGLWINAKPSRNGGTTHAVSRKLSYPHNILIL